MNVKVKICGVTRIEDACAAAEHGADLIGLNFFPRSPRYVTLERAREIRRELADRARIVGVFVNATREFVHQRIAELRLDLLQFHGNESTEFLLGWAPPVIRVFRLKPGERFDPSFAADYALLDTFHPRLYGGTGGNRPIADLRAIDLTRVFISGGLDPDNVSAAAALAPYGVDVASGVESAPGIKDHHKLRRFIENAKSAR